MRHAKGTNQYRVKNKKDVGLYMIGFLYLMILMIALHDINLLSIHKVDASDTRSELLSPIASPAASLRVVVSPTPAEMPNPIEDEIKQVFGKYYEKAALLLSCENNARNPEAMNDNTKWGGVGHDWGVFQINDHWQGVTNKAFLTDYHINIRMAYNIFSRDGYSFKLWTCGRKLGI